MLNVKNNEKCPLCDSDAVFFHVFWVIANSTATPFPVSAHFPKGQHLLGVIHTELRAALYRQIPMQTSIDCDSDF